MASLQFIKNLKTKNVDYFDMLVSFVFGKVPVEPYRSNKTYVLNDTIIRLNPDTNKYQSYRCKVQSTTGTFKPSDWTTNNVHDSVVNTFVEAYSELSETQPTDPLNRMWYQQTRSRGVVDPDTFVQ